jgi:hypothetical protein
MINYTDFIPDEDFDEVAESIDIDWDQKPSNTTEPPVTEPPYRPSNDTGDGSKIDVPMDIHDTNGFGLNFVGHNFGSEKKEVGS